jgi:putative transposase
MTIDGLQEQGIQRCSRTKCRLVYKGGIYHVTQRAPGDEKLFQEDKDYLKFVYLLKTVAKEFKLKIFSFSLLPNHLHLLLQIEDKNLSEPMKSLFENYAMYFNRKYDRKGHVFCGAFRDSHVDDDQYLIAACIYIHLNAFRAGLCDAGLRYRWHSLNLFVSTARQDSFVDIDKVMDLLGNDPKEARKKLVDLFDWSMKSKPRLFFDHRQIETQIKKNISGVFEVLKLEDPLRSGSRKKHIFQLLGKGYRPLEIISRLGISRATYFRVMRGKTRQPSDTLEV